MRKHLSYWLIKIVVSVSCAGAFVSCSKEQVHPVAKVSFIVIPDSQTKAALTLEDEVKVSSLDLLVFDSVSGVLDTHVREVADGNESLSGLEASVSSGISMDWYLLANLPAGLLSSVSTKQELLDKSVLLSDMSGKRMAMHAHGTETFSAEGNVIDNISLIRYACKVSVKNIRVSWLGTFAEAPSCTLDQIALVNVRGDEKLSAALTCLESDLWYNKSAVDSHSAFLDECLVWTGSQSIAGPDPHEVNISLYAMPNVSVNDAFGPVAVTGPWSPRRTRIAIRLTIDGTPQWYPVDLPAMVGKTHYIAEDVVIMGPGSVGPDEPIDRTSIDFTVNVYAWGEENQGTVVFPSVDTVTP